MMSITTVRMLSLYIYRKTVLLGRSPCWTNITYYDISRCSVIPEKELNISKYLIIDKSHIEFWGDIQIAICQLLDYQLMINYQSMFAYLQNTELRQSELVLA